MQLKNNNIKNFTIRVYGVLINKARQILLVNEKMPSMEFTKFPGGGLEFNEGIEDCLVREFKEETGLLIRVKSHIYTTGMFVQSAFNPNSQLIAIYYFVEPIDGNYEVNLNEQVITVNEKKEILRFFWIDYNLLSEELFTFQVDKFVLNNFLFSNLV